MITVYLDWSVMAQMKNGLLPDLVKILRFDRFLIPYSTSHIGDILSGHDKDTKQQSYIDSDLEFISDISRNYCLTNDSKKVNLTIINAKDLFNERVNEVDILKDFSLDKIAELFDGDERTKELGKMWLSLMKNIPLDKAFTDAFLNQEGSKQLDLLFPGLKDNPTMETYFKCFGEIINRMNDNEDYKELRRITQTGLGINRDEMFNSADPYTLIKKTYDKIKFDVKSFVQVDKFGPEWFNEVSNEYIHLDMHGYQEDRVRTRKGRKETFRNTTEDAFHAAFASTCNFYIVSDNRAYHKTQRVYEYLKLNTIVFKPHDFQNYYNEFLYDRSENIDVEIPIKYLEIGNFIESETEEGTLRTYHLPYFIFDFFNKMYVLYNKEGRITSIILGQLNPSNKKMTYYFEVQRLSPKLYKAFGQDIDGLGEIRREELEQENWVGRKWNFDGISFRFIRLSGHYQLYYDVTCEQSN
jgi:hypothetical protein